MKWNENYGIYAYGTLRAAFNKNEGNMAEINLLLVNLLRSAGVEAYPVLFSTRSHGMIKQFYPMYSSFNGVLACARLNGKDILMDATSTFLEPGELPENCMNGNGMKIMDKRIEWIPLRSSEQMASTSYRKQSFQMLF